MRVRFYSPQLCPLEDEARIEGNIEFRDESLVIASEYLGGLERYGVSESHLPSREDPISSFPNGIRLSPPNHRRNHVHGRSLDLTNGISHGQHEHHQSLPSIHGMLPPSYKDDEQSSSLSGPRENSYQPSSEHSGHSHRYSYAEEPSRPITDPNETLFMQVFIEEMGCWMDSMNSVKHFSQILPYDSLHQPMLYNAFLACGARHLSLVNKNYNEERALYYYNLATSLLLEELKLANRNVNLCATTAVVLNVYEIMCVSNMERMNHICGVRALIKECGWSARSTGVGAACFWLNVGMELLSCLHFNWQVAWDPDEWGVDMQFPLVRETRTGTETLWTHRMVYIVAKVANFRLNRDPQDLVARYELWKRLKDLADDWDRKVPRTMLPMAIVPASKNKSGSRFPEIWLPERSTVMARLFYHTTMVLLSQSHPYGNSVAMLEMRDLKQIHARNICGIVRHVTDRGIASVALRSSAIAAECLTERGEQDEVIDMFRNFSSQTGWRIGFFHKELMSKWGRSDEMSPGTTPQIPQQSQPAQQTVASEPPPTRPQPPQLPSQPAPHHQHHVSQPASQSQIPSVMQPPLHHPNSYSQHQQPAPPIPQMSNHSHSPQVGHPQLSHSIPSSLPSSRNRNSILPPSNDYHQLHQYSSPTYPPTATHPTALGTGSALGQHTHPHAHSLTSAAIAAHQGHFGAY